MSARSSSTCCLLFVYFNSRFIVSVCSDWLEWRDVARFDMAMSCQKNRKRWVNALSKNLKFFMGRSRNPFIISVECLRWLDLRRIDLQEMELAIDFANKRKFFDYHNEKIHASQIFLNFFQRKSLTSSGDVDIDYYFRHTESLSFKRCRGVTDDLIAKSCRVCPVLKRLCLSGCTAVTNISLICLSMECPKLQTLDLFGCSELSDTGLISIAESCSSLTSINLGWCSKISDRGIMALAAACSLEDLDIGGCPSLTDKAIISIFESSSQLQRLNMSYNTNYTDACLASSTSKCASTSSTSTAASNKNTLISLHLGKCPNISEEGLVLLAEGCCGLVELDLYSCEKVTDYALTRIIDSCPNLEVINLSHCYLVSDIGLVNLAERGLALRFVSLCGCDLISSEGLIFFREKNSHCSIKKDY